MGATAIVDERRASVRVSGGTTHARAPHSSLDTLCGKYITPATGLYDLAPTCLDCRALVGRAAVGGPRASAIGRS